MKKVALLFIISVVVSINVSFSQSHYPPEIQREIDSIKISENWSVVILLETLEITVRVTPAGINKESYLFYPDKEIPITNPHWEAFFPVFRQICNEYEAKQLVWAFNKLNIEKNNFE